MEERKESIGFKLDKPVFGQFLFETSLEGEGKFGKWHMYKFKSTANQTLYFKVKDDLVPRDVKFGEEHVFFASKGLDKKLVELGNLKDKNFKITKIQLKDENGNIVEKGPQTFKTFEVILTDAPLTDEQAETDSKDDIDAEPNPDEIPF